MSDILKKRKNQINIAIQDSLEQLRLDSINQAKIDSTALAKAHHIKSQNKIDSLYGVIDGVEEFQKAIKDKNQLIHGPVFSSTVNTEALEESILDLTRDLIQFEANSNVTEDYDDFINMYNELAQIHGKYQSMSFEPGAFGWQKGEGEWQFGAPSGHFGTGGHGPADSSQDGRISSFLLNDDNLRFKDMNGLDKVFGDVLNPIAIDEYGNHIPSDRDLERVTLSRLFASDKHIQNLVKGKAIVDSETLQYTHEQGFNDIIRHYNLGGATGFGSGENVKWALNYPLGETILLTEALKAKVNGEDYFNATSGQIFDNSTFNNVIGQYSTAQQQVIRNQLQGLVDEIYLRMEGIKEGIGGSAYFDKFNKLKERFGQDWYLSSYPGSRGASNMKVDTPGQYHGFSPEDDSKYKTYLDKKDKLYKEISGFEFLTGTKYDPIEALNLLSIEALDVQLEELPDYEKTQAFEDLLVTLSNQLGQVYTPAK